MTSYMIKGKALTGKPRGICGAILRLLLIVFLAMPSRAAVPLGQFSVRAFHIDMRVQVMKLSALKKLAYQLHQQGINTLIMEWEGSYPYLHEPLISNRYAYKRGEVRAFISYCHSLNMDVIPLQQTFGHVEYILKHYKYAALREDQKDFSQVCPTELDSCRALFIPLLEDMAEMHGSPYIHIGGDETFLLGHCEKCRRKVAQVGLSGLYFDYIKMICDIVVSLGKKPVLWADIALHYPEKIHLLPKQTVFVDWNYGWGLDNFGDHTQLLNSGYEIWGAPALRSDPDNFYLTCWKKHFENIRTFIPESRKLNYKGIVMTSWSTSGAYCTVFDSNNDPLALYPVRRVYPLSGFNLLVNAYTTAIQTDKPLDIRHFIHQYCLTHYGLTGRDAERFQAALFMSPYPVVNGKVQSKTGLPLAGLVDSAATACRLFAGIKPRQHPDEFRHYVLMSRIRLFYLEVLSVEAKMNSERSDKRSVNALVPVLIALKQESAQLNKLFQQLNGSYLVNGETAEENALRNTKLNDLYTQVMALKNE